MARDMRLLFRVFLLFIYLLLAVPGKFTNCQRKLRPKKTSGLGEPWILLPGIRPGWSDTFHCNYLSGSPDKLPDMAGLQIFKSFQTDGSAQS
jgi:hypothetical protein